MWKTKTISGSPFTVLFWSKPSCSAGVQVTTSSDCYQNGHSSQANPLLLWFHHCGSILLLKEEPVSGLERACASVPLGIRESFVSAQLSPLRKRYRAQVYRTHGDFKHTEAKQQNSLYLAYCWGCSWPRKISPPLPYDHMPGLEAHFTHY